MPVGRGWTRPIASFAVAVVLASVACSPTSVVTSPPPTGSADPSPGRTPDIRRAILDISYSAFVGQDMHNVSSKAALEAALEGVREEVRAAGGDDRVAIPSFKDLNDVVVSDFNAFADAIASLAAKNPQLTPERISTAAIPAMIRTSPDCHTYYLAAGRRYDSRSVRETGVSDPAVPDGVVLQGPDEAQLQARMLAGGVAWIRFREFRITGAYDIRKEVRKVLDVAVRAGAKAWVFDLRGNIGGNGADVIASYFLNGEPAMTVRFRSGQGGIASANAALRLPAEYQLPMAVILERGGSGPEVFALYLRENKRATLVGQRTIGCLGATSPTPLSDGSSLFVAVQEFAGAVTGIKYNNVGIEPDIAASDATAVDVAARHLREKIGGH